MDHNIANAEHITVWSDIIAPKYIRFRHILVGGLGAHAQAALSKHRPNAGEAVLDIGCGTGESTIELGTIVGPRGRVLGIDCCEPFLAIARRDAGRAETKNVQFGLADAQSERFERVYDLCFSRFGTMFFSSPVAAMRNIRSALRPGGRLLMVVWRKLDDNEWMRLAKEISLKHLPPPPEQAPNCGPGPFSLANADIVSDILTAAGFVEIRLQRFDAEVMVGKTIDDAIDFQLALGPAGEIVREAGAEGEQLRPRIVGELRELLQRYVKPEGVMMGSSSWAVSAVA